MQALMELELEDVSLLERCPHFRGWYVQTSMELGPEDVSLLERCPHFRGWYTTHHHISWSDSRAAGKSLVAVRKDTATRHVYMYHTK